MGERPDYIWADNLSGEFNGNRNVADLSVIARKEPLSERFPEEWTEAITSEALDFIERRFDKMQSQTTVSDYQLNVFLLLMMAPAYNIHSPYDLAGHIQTGPMAHGDSTAFGRLSRRRSSRCSESARLRKNRRQGPRRSSHPLTPRLMLRGSHITQPGNPAPGR